RAHHDALVLAGGRAAQDRLAREPAPALIVLDDAEACAALRRHDAGLPVLVVTADDQVGAAFEAGASDVLRAPYDARELAARVRGLVAEPRAGVALLERLGSLLSQAPIAICMLERPGLTFTYANPAYRALVGGREVVGKLLLEALPEIAHQGLDALLEGVFATGETYRGREVAFTLEHHRPGEFAVLNFQYSARRDLTGAIDGVIATVVDVTEQVMARRRAEALAEELLYSQRQLADERDKLAQIFEISPAAMGLWQGPALIFEKVNPQYQAIFAGRQLLGRPLLDAVPELTGQPFAALLEQVLTTGEPFVGREASTLIAGPDGQLEERFYDFTYARINGADGRPLGVYDHAIDVTERVLAHRRLLDSEAREQKLRQQAEDANRSKDEFLAMLGHEMRNPLAPITTALELMKLRAEDAFASERTVIQRQVDHLTRLVDDLLDVSRITRGKVEISRARVSLASLVASAVEMVSPLLDQRRHELTVVVAPHGLMLDADPVRMSQVISNLLTNAAKYTEPGGHVRLEAGRDGDEIWLSVSDDGVGIGAEMLPRVFELFAQAPQTIERARGGLGLGLAIVHSLVALHGGSVVAQSAGRGHGSRFTLRLPAAPDAAVPAAPPPVARPAVAGKRVLIVDDNVDAAELLSMTLELRGHTVRVANDGAEALRAVEDFTPDLALLDIGLPVMDGYELARRLRQLPALHALQLVALTGYGQASDRQRSAEAGFDAHLVKPLPLAELEALLARA
ncbi:MAG TPA: response regulator, partial [Kofleriaceae bacterium]